MSVQSVTLRGRVVAEARMRDKCLVEKVALGSVQDEVTGKFPEVRVTVYEGKCEFKAADYQVREIDAVSQQLVEQDATLKLPMETSTEVGKDMLFTITESALDSGLVGVSGRIKGPFAGSYTTARRFPVEVVS